MNQISDPEDSILEAIGVEHGFTVPHGDLSILRDIHLRVKAGESLAVLGPSGSGKSTLLGLLAGLDRPRGGRIALFGTRIDTLDEDGRAALRAGDARHRGVGFVFQSFQLLPALTAQENVRLPLDLAGNADADARSLEWLQRVGLGDRVDHFPRQLSGGEQQRVALARAFAGNPALLFADEPTGNLDRRTGGHVAERMFALQREQGATLILVTHDEHLAAQCDRRVHIDGGELRESA